MIKLFFPLFIILTKTSFQINSNLRNLTVDLYPFVLSSSDDYYYVITSTKSLKIGKESGIIKHISNNEFPISNFIYISDNSYNNYLYFSKDYYYITFINIL